MNIFSRNIFFLLTGILSAHIIHADWAMQTYETMSLDEKIGQLFVIPVTTDPSIIATPSVLLPKKIRVMKPDIVKSLVKTYHVGGIIFQHKNITEHQIALSNRLNTLSKTSLFFMQDNEYGLAMRHYNAVQFPRAMTLAAMNDKDFMYQVGREIAKQCKSIGVLINCWPIADINSDPRNPVIGLRSFGDNPDHVAQCAYEIMKSHLDEGVIPIAKHFPGHGNTHKDSHETLPTLHQDFSTLQSIDLKPFKFLIDNNVPALMTAHLLVPALEKDPRIPASLSPTILHYLRTQLGFNGLIVTDALDMGALNYFNHPGERELRALIAGADILLCPDNLPTAIDAIKKALREGIISEETIQEKVLKILKTKQALGINKKQLIKYPDQAEKLAAEFVARQAFEQAITLIKNEACLPLTQSSSVLFICDTPYHATLKNLIPDAHVNAIDAQVSMHAETVCMIITAGLDATHIATIKTIVNKAKAAHKKVILLCNALPYIAAEFENVDSILIGYESAAIPATLKVLYGSIKPSGKLPITTGPWQFGHGLSYQ